MAFGQAQSRQVDERIAVFDGENAQLMRLSPYYSGWRARLIEGGTRSRQGLRLAVADDVYAELQAFQDGTQPIAFASTATPTTRVRLLHAVAPDPERPLSHDTCEHFHLVVRQGDDIAAIARVIHAVSGLRARIQRNEMQTAFPGADGVHLHLRTIGIHREARVTPAGFPLDVLRVAEQDGTVAYAENIVHLDRLPLGRAHAEAHLKRLSFLSAPAAREMMRQLVAGTLTETSATQELLEASYDPRTFDPPSLCRICGAKFRPDWPLHERGSELPRWQICADCSAQLRTDGLAEREDADPLAALRELGSVLGRVPSARWREGIEGVREFDRFLTFVRAGWRVRPVKWYADRYGSWLQALAAAGILDLDGDTAAIGHRTVASDGHACLSLGEKTIDDWLFDNEIPHEREPVYPHGKFRGDWLVNGRLVEYFGLKGIPEYDARTEVKRAIARSAQIPLVEITPSDLADWEDAQLRVATELGITLR